MSYRKGSVNRFEFWTAIVAALLYFAALYLTQYHSHTDHVLRVWLDCPMTQEIQSCDNLLLLIGSYAAGMANFFIAAAMFLGGYTIALISMAHVRVHEMGSDNAMLIVYALRIAVGIAFLLVA